MVNVPLKAKCSTCKNPRPLDKLWDCTTCKKKLCSGCTKVSGYHNIICEECLKIPELKEVVYKAVIDVMEYREAKRGRERKQILEIYERCKK